MMRDTLIIKYSDKTKEIIVSNTGNSSQIEEIRNAILTMPTINFEN